MDGNEEKGDMTDWRERILSRIEEKGWSLNHLAVTMEFSQSTLSRALKGTGELKSNRLRQIAEALDTTVDWIMYGTESSGGNAPPLFEWPAQLLAWLDGKLDVIDRRINAPIPESAVDPFLWRHRLDDLSPEIPPGSILCISQEPPMQSGRIVMARHVDGAVCCRVDLWHAAGRRLVSRNDNLPWLEMDEQMVIIGTVVWMCRDL